MKNLRTSPLLLLSLLLLQLLLPAVTANTILTCPQNQSTSRETRLKGFDPVRRFTEVSGLVFSDQKWNNNPLLYAVTDGLNNNTLRGSATRAGRIGVFRSASGARLTSLALPDATFPHWDFEALTYGSCGTTESDANVGLFGRDARKCIYLADVGVSSGLNRCLNLFLFLFFLPQPFHV